MEAKLANVKLTDIIISETNKMFRDEAELSNEALKELINSVRDKGVIQPVLLRFIPGSKTYELVAGERRYRSSLAIFAENKKKDTIPAYIRELSNEEAFELQVVENLERKDVHPLKEAHAYKYLVDKDPKLNTVAELALRFGKTENYISTRLKLNDLIPDGRKDFLDGMMSLGHALLIARLTPEDQKKTIESCTDYFWKDGKEKVRFYQTVSELEDHINSDIICNLSSAAFKRDDATLLPKAGACTTCPKRSGANQLFADVKDKDRCFDRACFLAKRVKYVATQLSELIETEPDLALLSSNRAKGIDPAIEKVLKATKVKVLTSADYETYNHGNRAKINGMYINGEDVGRRVVVFSSKAKEPAKKGSTPDQVNVKEAIARIKERTERAIELDQEKVYGRILEALEAHPTQKSSQCDVSYYNSNEDVFLRFIIWDKLGYSEKKDLAKELKYKNHNPADLYKALAGMTHQQVVYMMRLVMLSQYGGNQPTSDHAYIIKAIAYGYKDIPISTYEDEQKAARKIREERAAARIKALQPAKSKAPAADKPKAAKSNQKLAKGLNELINS